MFLCFYQWQPLPPSPPVSSPLLADSATLEISRTMAGVKAWITVVSYLSPHLQPVVSLSEDVVKPSQTLKHPVASPCLFSPHPQPHIHTYTHTSPLWQFTLGWGPTTVDGSRARDAVCWEILDLFWVTWNMGCSYWHQVKPKFRLYLSQEEGRGQRVVFIMKWATKSVKQKACFQFDCDCYGQIHQLVINWSI